MATTLTISVLADVAKAVQGIDSIDSRTKSWGQSLTGAAAALGGAFSINQITDWAKEWVSAGLDAKRALKDVTVALGDSAGGVQAWGETAASTFGTTAAEADKMAAKVGIALEGYGISQGDAAKMSELLVQRSADVAKVMGTDTLTVLGKVETAMRGRTAGLKDYGVEVAKGSDSTAIFNAFMDQTGKMAGQSDTQLGTFHATMGDLTATLGEALIPVLMAVLPLIQAIADWATNNHAAFVAIVLVVTGLALAFGVATTAAGIFAVVTWATLWPILAVVAGIIALVAIVVLVIKYWGDLVQWFHDGASAVQSVIDKLGPLIFLFGPLGVAIGVIEHFGQAWDAVKGAVDAVYNAINRVVGLAQTAFDKIGSVVSKIPGLGAIGLSAPAGAAPSAYGVSTYAAPVTFAPSITFTGDVGDPVLAGRRVIGALEAWAGANGRRRIAALVSP